MAMKLELARRATRYFDDGEGWSSVEDLERICQAKILPARRLSRTPSDVFDVRRTLRTVELPAGLATRAEQRAAKQAIVDTLSGSTCQHDHDCCGCWSHHARILRRRGRSLSVLITSSCNV